jgi:predicted ATPase/DNA-binding SARP family transcriptional activator
MPQLQIKLLGPLQITLDGVALAFRYEKVRALLAYLAAEADRPHTRATLAGVLWPESPEVDARRNLSQALFQLRQTIRDTDHTPPWLIITRDTLQLNPDADQRVDVVEFDRLVTACATHRHEAIEACPACAQRLEQAAELYRGDFLQHFQIDNSLAFEEWALFKREGLHHQMLETLAHLTAYQVRCGAHAEVRRYAQRQLDLEPWREEAHRQVMQALADSGQRSAALAQYEACRKILLEELGVEPAAETTALYEHLKRAEVLSPESGSAAPHGRRRLALPTQVTPFLGRQQELAQLAEVLSNPACRLVTLIGPGGMGKTRLAVQAAVQQQANFDDGAAFVALASLANREQVVTAMADALGLVLYIAGDRANQLLHYLQERSLLLVLDNFEHLLADASCVALMGELLRGAPSLKLIVTSRMPLDIAGEWVFEVAGLGEEAVTLFAQSARRTRVGFALHPTDLPHIARICQLVGEMPLAVELAASWVRVLSCAEIVAEIERSFVADRSLAFLATTTRDIPERHRSLTAVFDHSWQLLSADERRALRQLAVFRGGFSREAAEAVAVASLSVLSALVSKSLLRRTSAGRYDLHELVRQYALKHLQANEQEVSQTLDRHCRYFTALLAQRGPALKSADRQTVVTELLVELDNLRLSWNWAAAHERAAELSQAADTLFWLYESRCNCREGVPLFEQAARGLQTIADQPVVVPGDVQWAQQLALGQVLSYQGHFCFRQGQHPQARDLLQRSLMVLQALDDQRGTVEQAHIIGFASSTTAAFLGMVTAMMGDYAEGRRWLQESLTVKRALNDRWGIVLCLRELGLAAYQQGEYAEARAFLSESHALSRELGNAWAIAFSLNCLSMAVYAQGQLREAQQLLQEGLAISQSLEDRYNIAFALDGLGRVQHAQGDDKAAAQLFTTSIALSREIGDQASVAQGLTNLGHALLAQDNRAEARRCFQEALTIAREMQLTPIVLDGLAGMAALHAVEGRSHEAWGLLQQIVKQPAANRETRDRAEKLCAVLETELTPAQIAVVCEQMPAATLGSLVKDSWQS